MYSSAREIVIIQVYYLLKHRRNTNCAFLCLEVVGWFFEFRSDVVRLLMLQRKPVVRIMKQKADTNRSTLEVFIFTPENLTFINLTMMFGVYNDILNIL